MQLVQVEVIGLEQGQRAVQLGLRVGRVLPPNNIPLSAASAGRTIWEGLPLSGFGGFG